MQKHINETQAAKKLRVIAIMDCENRYVGKVLAYFTDDSTWVEVFQFDGKGLIHSKKAHGTGYDRFTKALSGCVFDGHELVHHCQVTLPNGDYKASGLDYLIEQGYKTITLL